MSIELAIFDVDDVVINMDQAAARGEAAVRAKLRAHMGAGGADAVADRLTEGYEILRRQLRSDAEVVYPEFSALKARLEHWQRGSMGEGFELKIFSRHALLAVGLEKENVQVTETIINDVIDHYWAVLGEASVVMDGARAIIPALRAQGAHIHLATNSDGFLRFDEEKQTFFYEPEDAVRRKRQRLSVIAEVGVQPEEVSVGDPIGKPKAEFYEAVLASVRAAGCDAPLERALCVGDSLVNDVLPLMKLGVARGAWLVHSYDGPPKKLSHPGVIKIGDLRDLGTT